MSAGNTPVERIEKFASEWPKGSHHGDELHGLNLGEDTRHAELLMSDILAVLSDRAELLAVLISTRANLQAMADEGIVAQDSWPTIDLAIAKAIGQ